MSFSPILEVAIALVLIYYILGLMVSFISARILESLGTRGRDLEDNLKKLIGEAKLKEVMMAPQVKALAPVKYDGWRGVFTSKIKEETAKIEQIPVTNLVDAVFDNFLLVDRQKPYKVDELNKILGILPDSDAKAALLKLVNEGVTDINQLRSKTSMWFSGVLNQASDYYKAHARQWVIILSLLVAFLFGVDSIQLSKSLWKNADLRASANALATAYAKDSSNTDITKLANDLKTFDLQIGWWKATADLPATGKALDWVGWAFLKVLGLGITAAAVSQGSSFWYDMLRQLKGEKAAAPSASSGGGQGAAAG
jgi:hypothetical protein